MSLLSGLMGHHSEVDLSELQEEFPKILVEGEQIDQAFRLLRDLVVFTSKRIIHVDRQSMTGRKVVYESIPYTEVSRFAVETAGTFDTDSELRIWLRGRYRALSPSNSSSVAVAASSPCTRRLRAGGSARPKALDFYPPCCTARLVGAEGRAR